MREEVSRWMKRARLGLELERGLQKLAVLHFIFVWIILPLIMLWLPLYILCTDYWWTVLLYSIWFLYDYDTPRHGSRPQAWYRNSSIWRHFADYFPLVLVKTADLPPDRNYIIGCHPHGVFSIGAFTTMCTNGTAFEEKFPGLRSTLLTLAGQFLFPVRREIGILLGGTESSGSCLKWLLEHPGRGRAIGIVIGGAEEALDAHPGRHRINLLHRRGFLRYALKYGADLVPMYSFGENECYSQTIDNTLGTRLRQVQTAIKRRFGFCPPLIQGCGIFQTSFGLLPRTRAIHSVMGSPIRVEATLFEPLPEQIEDLHSKYCSALHALFEKHKADYGVPEDVHLTMY